MIFKKIRLLCLFTLAMALALCLAACNGTEQPKQTTEQSSTDATEPETTRRESDDVTEPDTNGDETDSLTDAPTATETDTEEGDTTEKTGDDVTETSFADTEQMTEPETDTDQTNTEENDESMPNADETEAGSSETESADTESAETESADTECDVTHTDETQRDETETDASDNCETTAPEQDIPVDHAHEWIEATCQAPKTCSVCGATEGELGEHKGGVEQCMKKKVCDVCGKEYGNRKFHRYTERIATEEYLKAPATINTKALYYFACVDCGKKSDTLHYEYGETLLEEMVEKYKAEDGDVEKFLFFTDPHYVSAEAQGTWSSGTLAMLDKMGEYYNEFKPSFAISGGDWLNDSNTRQNAIEMLKDIKLRTQALFGKCYLVVGNHDYNYQTRLDVPNTTTQSAHELTLDERIAAWYEEYGATYYSFDGENTKFYVFDTGKDWDHREINDFDREQIAWYLENLAANDDLHIALVAHIVYANETTVHPATLIYSEISAAYNARDTYEYNGKTYDFSGKTGRVELIMGGHEHCDKSGLINGIPFVMTASARGSSAGIPFFDIVLADYDEREVRIICVAGGSERTVALGAWEDDEGGNAPEETEGETVEDTTEATTEAPADSPIETEAPETYPEPEGPQLEYTLDVQTGTYAVSGMGDITGSTVIIPETYRGKAVTAILDGAFKDTGITDISFGTTITYIGADAFFGSGALSINFDGTRQDWKNVNKDTNWKNGVLDVSIYIGRTSEDNWEIPIQ